MKAKEEKQRAKLEGRKTPKGSKASKWSFKNEVGNGIEQPDNQQQYSDESSENYSSENYSSSDGMYSSSDGLYESSDNSLYDSFSDEVYSSDEDGIQERNSPALAPRRRTDRRKFD